mgnify:CR=1 FL=1
MENSDFNTILVSVGRLEGKVDGINARLDRTNGSIAKHAEKIDMIEADANQLKGKIAVWGIIFGLIGSTVVVVINKFIR